MKIEEYCKLLSIDSTYNIKVDNFINEYHIQKLNQDKFVVFNDAIEINLINILREKWITLFKQKQGFSLNYDLTLSQKNYTHNFFGKYIRHFDFYWNPPTCKTSRDVSLILHYIRNKLTGFHPLYGLTYHPDSCGVYLALTYYPLESGEMAVHVDPNYFLPIHFILPLTFKSKDYKEGGLFIHTNEEVVDIDSQMNPGSLLFFNGSSPHEVKKVQGTGVKSSLGRLQMFSIPTKFEQTHRHSLLHNIAFEFYGRLKYKMYSLGIGFKENQRNFR